MVPLRFKTFSFTGLALFLGVGPLMAYTDKMAVETPEVWKAVQAVAAPYGVRKADSKKYEIETRWIQDLVVRSRGLWKKLGTGENMQRRYRVKIRLKEEPYATEVGIHGVFQERSYGSGPAIPWRNIKPESEDYAVERDFFFKILKQLETTRKQNPPARA